MITNIISALLLLTNSGMHIGWSIFNILNAETWKLEASFEEIIWAQISWFLGIAMGALIGGLLIDITGRRHTQVIINFLLYSQFFFLNNIYLHFTACCSCSSFNMWTFPNSIHRLCDINNNC